MCKVLHTIAKIEVSDYINSYRDVDRFIKYCKNCNRYNTCWSCPPFDFDADKYISDFGTAYIIGTKILIDKDIIEENKGKEKCTAMSYSIIDKARFDLDRKLLEIGSEHHESKVFFAGPCRICPADSCTRTKGKQCISPNRVRPSLESFGFDIARTSSELLNIDMKWGIDAVLPEYFTLVSGLFVKTSNIKESDILNTFDNIG